MSFPTRVGQRCCGGRFAGFLREECSSIAAVISSERTSDQHVDFRVYCDHTILSRSSSASINGYSDWVLPDANSLWISIAFLISADGCGANLSALDALRVSKQLSYKDFVDKLVPYCSFSALQSCSYERFTTQSRHFRELAYVFEFTPNKLGATFPLIGLTIFTIKSWLSEYGAIKFVRFERISL